MNGLNNSQKIKAPPKILEELRLIPRKTIFHFFDIIQKVIAYFN
jgi:hypothetical protein